MITFLRWVFSNSGVVGGAPDVRAHLLFLAARRPLFKKTCRVCSREYWAYTRGNYYCGRFACFKRLQKGGKNVRGKARSR